MQKNIYGFGTLYLLNKKQYLNKLEFYNSLFMTIVLGTVLSCFSRVQLCNSMHCTQLGSSVHGILQARILGRVVMASSRESSHPRDRTHVSCFLQCYAGTLPPLPLGKFFMIISETIYKLTQFSNNLRDADDTILMAESEEELNSLLMKVKEEREKIDLNLNIQKTKFTAFGPITLWQTDGETMATVRDFILGLKITANGD